jgi:peptide/nickel transport system permease protein
MSTLAANVRILGFTRAAFRSSSAWTRAALVVAVGWAIVAAVGPNIAPYDPLALGTDGLVAPSLHHLLGTDELGRDILSRLLSGARVSITFSVVMVALSVMIGAAWGGVAGYFGGWVDEVMMRIADFVFAFPTIVLAMAIAAALGPSLRNAVIAVVLVTWPTYARVCRTLVRSTLHSDYVSAARLLGASSIRVMRTDVLPNAVGPILVFATLGLGDAMLVLAGLSFLGLGSQPPAPEWGSMISNATQYPDSWWLALFPGLAIISLVASLNILGDYLRDALDARVTGSS